MKGIRAPIAWLLCAVAMTTQAAPTTVEVPLNIPYALVRAQLAERVFIEPEETLHALSDASGCNKLKLSAPTVEGAAAGGMQVAMQVEARGGTPVPGGACLLPFSWSGRLILRESARVADSPTAIAFRIVDSDIRDESGKKETVPGVMWGWVKQYVHPRIEAFTFELAPLLGSSRELLSQALSGAPDFATLSANSLHIANADGGHDALVATLAFDMPDVNAAMLPPRPHAPLTANELMAWDQQWQAWDAFATWLIKTVAVGASPALREALSETLLEARYDLRDALANDALDADPVRKLFVHAWQRLTPLLNEMQLTATGDTALRYLALINAGDALRALDSAGAQFGVRFDQATLRQLARLLLPAVDDAALRYSDAPDPALRELLGLPPELAPAATAPHDSPWLAGWIAAAQATEVDAASIARLNQWLPGDSDLDAYLNTLDGMLADIAEQEQGRGKVQAPFMEVYRTLLRATAWQETCWRQYVKEAGRIEPLRSSAGSVGLMQINQHVWRGVYDLNKLAGDIGYNARAGNEILVHYLVDFAIKKKEHEATGDPHNLARATYAVYNGGPGHLRRYRDPKESRSLREIDAAFWKKYQALRASGVAAVKQCYAP
ncbi:MAG: lytic transglycosylase domain-containing protein [Gammaproteobacteria bacterium]|nr:lytic transglycosylase domain-containing protein [Gammaproteobacteria bacterium]